MASLSPSVGSGDHTASSLSFHSDCRDMVGHRKSNKNDDDSTSSSNALVAPASTSVTLTSSSLSPERQAAPTDPDVARALLKLAQLKEEAVAAAASSACNHGSDQHKPYTWKTTLSPGQFKELWQHVDEDCQQAYLCRNIRLSYDASRHRLTVIVMPSRLHEAGIGAISTVITRMLDRLRNNTTPAVAQFIARIHCQAQDLIEHQDGSGRQPDVQYRHSDAHFPGVVIEVSYSQSLEEATKVAKQCILRSGGRVAVAIILDFPDYCNGTANRKRQAANRITLSLWRADNQGVVLEIDQKEILCTDTTAALAGDTINTEEDTLFTLKVADFAPMVARRCHDGTDDDNLLTAAISVTMTELAYELADATLPKPPASPISLPCEESQEDEDSDDYDDEEEEQLRDRLKEEKCDQEDGE